MASRNVIIYYKDLEWGEKLKELLLQNCKDSLYIRLYDIQKVEGVRGVRCGIAFCQDILHKKIFYQYILPSVNLKPWKCFVWYNGKFFDYQKIYLEDKGYQEEVKRWLSQLEH